MEKTTQDNSTQSKPGHSKESSKLGQRENAQEDQLSGLIHDVTQSDSIDEATAQELEQAVSTLNGHVSDHVKACQDVSNSSQGADVKDKSKRVASAQSQSSAALDKIRKALRKAIGELHEILIEHDLMSL